MSLLFCHSANSGWWRCQSVQYHSAPCQLAKRLVGKNVSESGQLVIHKRRPYRGGRGGLCQKWTNVDIGEGVLKLHWTSTNCTIILTLVAVYSCLTLSFQEMTDACSSSKMQNAWLKFPEWAILVFSVRQGTHSGVKNRNRSMFTCSGCTDYRHWYLMTGTLC